MKKLLRCRVTLFLLFGWVALSVAGYLGKDSRYKNYTMDARYTPYFVPVLQGIHDGIFPWSSEPSEFWEQWEQRWQKGPEGSGGFVAGTELSEDRETSVAQGNGMPSSGADAGSLDGNTGIPDTTESAGAGDMPAGGNGTSGTAASGEGAGETLPRQNEADGETGIPSDGAGGQGGEAGLPAGENGGGTGGNASEGAPEDGSGETQPTAGEAAPKSFTDVDESYFDDAVFIGDSRTVGLHDYSGLDNATFYASVGLSVYDMWTDAFCEVDGKKITLEEALLARQFKKVYFQIGINEMGRGTVDGFITAYSQSVQKLKELQPDAVIYVQAIMRVAKEKSDSDPIFNNKGINERNARIAQLADSRTVFYIDVNEVVCDQEGNLRDELTFDNLHLLGSKYDIWVSFLKTKGIL